MRHGVGVQGAREDELFSTPLRPSVPEGEPVAAPVCELREGVGAATPQANRISVTGGLSSLSYSWPARVEMSTIDTWRQAGGDSVMPANQTSPGDCAGHSSHLGAGLVLQVLVGIEILVPCYVWIEVVLLAGGSDNRSSEQI